MNTTKAANLKTVYWHRELPPVNMDALGEHVVEATSKHVSNTLLHRDELWDCCYEDLIANACARIKQEVVRLGGTSAHVLDESVNTLSNDVTQEAARAFEVHVVQGRAKADSWRVAAIDVHVRAGRTARLQTSELVALSSSKLWPQTAAVCMMFDRGH